MTGKWEGQVKGQGNSNAAGWSAGCTCPHCHANLIMNFNICYFICCLSSCTKPDSHMSCTESFGDFAVCTNVKLETIL